MAEKWVVLLAVYLVLKMADRMVLMSVGWRVGVMVLKTAELSVG
jgi:hypothetical protein